MTAPRPIAAITLPRMSLGTVSAINAEHAGVKNALYLESQRPTTLAD